MGGHEATHAQIRFLAFLADRWCPRHRLYQSPVRSGSGPAGRGEEASPRQDTIFHGDFATQTLA